MKKIFLLTALFTAYTTSVVQAAEKTYEGLAKPWQLGMLEPASPVMERLVWMHDTVLVAMCIAISIFILALMVYICLRFNKKKNPVPSKSSHNTKLEIIWTTIPILILVALAVPSLKLHYFMERHVDSELTLKVVAYQWYWNYEYPDQGGIKFDSYMLKDDELKEGDHRLLSVDNRIVVPIDTKIRVKLTAADVIHSFAVPSFGIKRDAIPGRLNETWFKATKIGTFYGQCSELCGIGHGFMPIVVDVVSKEDFNKWVAMKKEEAGIVDKPAEEKSTKTDIKSDNESSDKTNSKNKHKTK